MKRVIVATTDPYKQLAKAIADIYGVSQEAANIVSKWYRAEDMLDDYDDDIDAAIEYIDDDIQDMLDAATDPDEIQIVGEAFGIDVSHLLGE